MWTRVLEYHGLGLGPNFPQGSYWTTFYFKVERTERSASSHRILIQLLVHSNFSSGKKLPAGQSRIHFGTALNEKSRKVQSNPTNPWTAMRSSLIPCGILQTLHCRPCREIVLFSCLYGVCNAVMIAYFKSYDEVIQTMRNHHSEVIALERMLVYISFWSFLIWISWLWTNWKHSQDTMKWSF